jgi:enamine deaminase RidA (YjgF/YER057c/UK114 family)
MYINAYLWSSHFLSRYAGDFDRLIDSRRSIQERSRRPHCQNAVRVVFVLGRSLMVAQTGGSIMHLKLENPGSVAAPLGRYTHTVEVPPGAGLVFISGQAPVAPDGSVAPSLAEQADQVYANIVAVLAAKGIPPQNVIKLTTFFTDEDDPDDSVRKARAKYLGEHRPASTAVCVRRLVDPNWKIEIDAVALMP